MRGTAADHFEIAAAVSAVVAVSASATVSSVGTTRHSCRDFSQTLCSWINGCRQLHNSSAPSNF